MTEIRHRNCATACTHDYDVRFDVPIDRETRRGLDCHGVSRAAHRSLENGGRHDVGGRGETRGDLGHHGVLDDFGARSIAGRNNLLPRPVS